MYRFLATNQSSMLLFQRVILGLVMFPHGAQKLLGWFGGPGWSGTISGFAGMGMPTVLTMLVIFSEFFGSLGLIVGLGTRLAALGTTCVMLGAVLLVHLRVGFFMNWGGQQMGEGYEYHLLALALSLPLLVKGGGLLSIDGAIAKRT